MGVSYDRQGYIYFTLRHYKTLSPEEKDLIVRTAKAVCNGFDDLVLDYCTSDMDYKAACYKHHTAESVLYRYVARFYRAFPL
jgi:hypothetical protein